MTAREKASDIYNAMYFWTKNCALICVAETIKELELTKPSIHNMAHVSHRLNYWYEVKTEIIKLP